MRQINTRRFKTKAGAVAVAVLDEAHKIEELEAPELVIVLARRDLVFLQQLFNALDRRDKIPDYKRMQKAVTLNLDSLSGVENHAEPQPAQSKRHHKA